jgi:hypothetical protein
VLYCENRCAKIFADKRDSNMRGKSFFIGCFNGVPL